MLIEKKTDAVNYALDGYNKKQIAKMMSVKVSTVQRWFRDSDVKKTFLDASKGTVAEVKKYLEKNLMGVSESLVDIALNAKSEMARYRASRHILEICGIIPPKVSVSFEKKQITIMKGILKE